MYMLNLHIIADDVIEYSEEEDCTKEEAIEEAVENFRRALEKLVKQKEKNKEE